MKKYAGMPHDAVFKKFLTHPDTAREFLDIHLPPALRALCDLATLSVKPDSFVEPGLRAAYTDILYSLSTTRGDGYIYCLIEHQSTPDPMMAFRMMQYCLRVMRAHLDNIKDETSRKLPIVIPLLFYQGKTAYPYSVDWFDCFADPETARTIYNNAFPLIDLAGIPDDEIMKHGRVALLELVQKHIRQRDMMNFLDHFVYLLSLNRLTPDQWESFLRYVLDAGSTDDAQGFISQLARRLPDSEEEKMMMTIAEQLRQEGLEKGLMEGLKKGRMEGLEEGLEKGLEKGRYSASRDIARELLSCGINFETVLKTTGLGRDELEQMLQ